jgi:hypothetical protein
MPVKQVVPVVCPSCKTQFSAPVQNIIDGQDLALKSAFLQGQVNMVQCPQCGFANLLNIPILYYDLEKELALVLVPTELNLTVTDQEKAIGTLTNTLVNDLPAEQRKYYLLNPSRFLPLESMVKAILEADGITEEVLKAKITKTKLIEELLQISDEATLKEKVKAHDAELDYEFFEMLTTYMQVAQMEGDQARTQALFALRTLIGQWSTQGKKAIAEIDAKLGLVVVQSREELLEKLQNAKDDQELEALVNIGYVLLDYAFFQQLTAKIDHFTRNGEMETASALKDLRTSILDLKANHEERSRVALEKAATLFKEILQSDKPDKMIEQKLDEIDEAFFVILRMNIEEAQRQKQDEVAQALAMIGNMAMAMLEEHHSQELQAAKAGATSQIYTAK